MTIGTTAALIGAGLIGGGMAYSGYESSKAASQAAESAANVSADAQTKALEYLQETEEIPQQFRESSLKKLAGIYGLEGGEGSQEEFINYLKETPLYNALVGQRAEGEEAIMRQASATGGLRSGNVQEALYDYNTQLGLNALLDSYNMEISGLGGLAQLPSLAPSIAGAMAGIGTTQAQGILGSAQASQTGTQNTISNLMGLGSLGVSAYGAGVFSDRRLKIDINPVGQINDIPIYSFKWNDIAKEKFGLEGISIGAIADEVKNIRPEAVGVREGYLTIDYSQLF
jgi:hypothetical protein